MDALSHAVVQGTAVQHAVVKTALVKGETTRRRSAGYSAGSLALPVFHLRHLLAAGVPLADALQEVAALETNARRRALWAESARRVASGDSLSRALSRFPHDIDDTSLALIRAGEASGRLSVLLGELEAHLRWHDELGARLKTLTVYPLFAGVLLLGVVGFLMGQVVPELVTFLADGGASLPWHGLLLLQVSSLVSRHFPVLLLLAVLLLGLVTMAPRLGRFPHVIRDTWLLRLSGIGPLVAGFRSARWARTTSLLYRSGIALDQSLLIAEGALGNRALVVQLASARRAVLGGLPLGKALQACPLLPASLRRLITAGESTGNLALALEHGAAQVQSSAQRRLARLEALLAPALLCLTGGLLLWIVYSILAPLYAGVTALGVA